MPQSKYPKADQPQKSKPAHEIRIRNVKATIWKNVSDEGITRFNTTFSRSYKTDDKWHTSDSIGFYDLIDVSKAANLAFDWISQQEADQHNDQAVTS